MQDRLASLKEGRQIKPDLSYWELRDIVNTPTYDKGKTGNYTEW